MANLIITYWRDIPSAVSVKAGRKEEKRMLADRFQEAIDMAAMRGGASDTDSYLADWRRGEPGIRLNALPRGSMVVASGSYSLVAAA